MKIRNNQLVYFYEKTGEYQGTIVAGVITSIVKNLEKNKTYYNVKTTKTFFGWDAWCIDKVFTLEKNQLYTSKKQIEKEYKEEIVYNNLSKKLSNIESILNSVFNEVKESVEKPNFETLTITGEKAFSKLYVDAQDIKIGDISIKEEIAKIKKDIKSIKNKIKSKTKKPVIKEEKKDTNE